MTNAARTRLRRSGGAVALLVAVAAVVTASTSGGGRYTVQPGDTLSAIAARYHTSVAALVRLNQLPGSGNLIIAGSTLRLPGHGHAAHGAATHTVVRHYVVKPGDSLYAIAARYKHAGWRAIAHRNHLPSSLVVVIGQRLEIPQRVHGRVHHAAAPQVRHLHGPVASRDQVVAMIRATAARWGVDQRLALAISYEEAGFNQSVVSPVGAIGAMQVMPATGEWLSAYVVHRRLDIRRAQDNITAGVALLSVLVHETGGNLRTAIAGYYQGLASVLDRGMYDDTKQYVANVLALRNRF
jgi:N-acetylmuramoyl-L-alanine amidase